jgi:hypothetical protein
MLNPPNPPRPEQVQMKPTFIGAPVAVPLDPVLPADPALPVVGPLDAALPDVGLVAAFLLLDEHAPSTPAIVTAARTDNSFRFTMTFSAPPPCQRTLGPLVDPESIEMPQHHRKGIRSYHAYGSASARVDVTCRWFLCLTRQSRVGQNLCE